MASLAMATQAQKLEALNRLLTQQPDIINTVNTFLAQIKAEDAVAETKNTFPFEKLPAELRNEIYEFALVAPGPIRLARKKDEAASKTMESLRERAGSKVSCCIYKMSATFTPGKESNGRRQQRQFPYKDFYSAAILRLSKSIYAEAHPILYGRNAFILNKMPALTHFKAQIGEGFNMLTDVEIKGVVLATHLGNKRVHNASDRGTDLSVFQNVSTLRHLAVEVVGLDQEMKSIDGVVGVVFDEVFKKAYNRITDCNKCRKNKMRTAPTNCVCISAEEREKIVNTLTVKLSESARVGFARDTTGRSLTEEEGMEMLKAKVLQKWQQSIAYWNDLYTRSKIVKGVKPPAHNPVGVFAKRHRSWFL